jgi:Flp pilus assembly pilin Flp
MLTPLRSMLRDEAGATMAEYGLLIALIAIAALLGVASFGRSVNALFRSPPSTFNIV